VGATARKRDGDGEEAPRTAVAENEPVLLLVLAIGVSLTSSAADDLLAAYQDHVFPQKRDGRPESGL
jgi:hypothetical protein